MGNLVVLVMTARLIATFHVYKRWVFERVTSLSQRIHMEVLRSSINTRLTVKEKSVTNYGAKLVPLDCLPIL